jgi:ribonuclease E
MRDGEAVEISLISSASGAADGAAVGDYFAARVKRKVPSLGAAFVEIEPQLEAYLEASDLPGEGTPAERLTQLADGALIAVQVRRGAVGGKRARVSAKLEFSGRQLAYRPEGERRRISRRIIDEQERQRLDGWLGRVAAGGVVLRTAAGGASDSELDAELQQLIRSSEALAAELRRAPGPSQLGRPVDRLGRLLDSLATRPLRRVVVESRDEADEIAPRLPADCDLVVHSEATDLYAASRMDDHLRRAAQRRLHLPSGGSIVIERTEALIAIDVNTAAIRSVGNAERTVVAVNLEAAKEIARQIRLRDLCGTIVIDFIDMKASEDREAVAEALREGMQHDRRTHRVAGWTPLGLCEISRRREGASWSERLALEKDGDD